MKENEAGRLTPAKRAPKAAAKSTKSIGTPRLSKEAREHQIVQKAIQVFAERGFSASTHEIARAVGITQPLLYNYFPTKEALVDRVYDEVFVRKWDPVWEDWLSDSTQPLAERLKRYLKDYARFVLKSDWVRIFISAGLSREGINRRYVARLRERHLKARARARSRNACPRRIGQQRWPIPISARSAASVPQAVPRLAARLDLTRKARNAKPIVMKP